jgi:Flp pilus assembly protein CpaB
MTDIELPAQSAPKQGNTTLLIVAIVMALMTVILTNVYIEMVKREVEQAGIIVYKLRRNIEPGSVIKDKDLVEVKIPAQFAESLPGRIKPEEKSNWVNNNNAPVERLVREGEMLTTDLFTSDARQIDYKITPGKRGCPLPLSSRTAPGLLKPGMFIDVLGTFPMGGSQLPKTHVVMEHVKVIAVGALTEESDAARRSSYSNITVEVEPTEAEILITTAKYIGKEGFDILIRQPKDNQPRFLGINPEVRKLVGLD